METSTALINFGGRRGCERLQLPPECPSPACRQSRDDDAFAELVRRGVIDP